jgi:hypothetical protein
VVPRKNLGSPARRGTRAVNVGPIEQHRIWSEGREEGSSREGRDGEEWPGRPPRRTTKCGILHHPPPPPPPIYLPNQRSLPLCRPPTAVPPVPRATAASGGRQLQTHLFRRCCASVGHRSCCGDTPAPAVATSPEPELGRERDGGRLSGWSWVGAQRRRPTFTRRPEWNRVDAHRQQPVRSSVGA